MGPVPNLPHVLYAAGPDREGQWWIEFGCRACDPSGRVLWRRACSEPKRTNYWVVMWANQHLHRQGY